MIRFAKNYPLGLWILGWLLCPLFTTLQAQEDLLYSGTEQVGKYRGHADYTYKIVKGDTVLDGPFLMRKSDLEALINKEDISFLFKGAFQDGYAHGKWRFQFGAFASESESQVVDYQYRVLVSGVQEEATGSLLGGKPDGEWNFTVNQIEDSEVEATLFKSTITFANGIPQRNFNIENENSTLVGRFLRDGLAHDTWSLYTNDGLGATESWRFEEGILRRIDFEKDGRTTTVSILEQNVPLTRTINLDARYIKALQLQGPLADTLDILSTDMPALLSENAEHYRKIDTILSELGKSAFLPEFKVKVPYFPLDSLESVQMDSIAFHYRRADAIADTLLNSSQLNILKRSDSEALFFYETVENIAQEFLRPLERLVSYRRQDILESVSRDRLLSGLFPKGRPSAVIKLGQSDGLENERTFALPDAERYDFGGDELTSVEHMAFYAFRSLDSIQRVLDKTLTAEQRQQELVAYEKKMIAQSDMLSILVDSVGPELPKEHSRALEQLRINQEKQLSDYSSTGQTGQKLVLARKLTGCFSAMGRLAHNIAALPERREELRELYQDAVWNPFMATVMSEEVKKRIMTAYRRVLVPYFLQRAADIGCDNIDELTSEMAYTDERMQALRNEDTRKLERKLRREQDPKKILELIGRTEKTDEK